MGRYNNWDNCIELSAKAKKHTAYNANFQQDNINRCIEESKIYGRDIEHNYFTPSVYDYTTNIIVAPTDSVNAAMEAKQNNLGKICILNFASYKNPGGGFISGSSAQEESLCHASILYNILAAFKDTYYAENGIIGYNKGLYNNRAIYTPDVIFFDDNPNCKLYKFDVLTCAAPNNSVGLRYGKFTREENKDALEDRIMFVLDIMNQNNVDTAILGAYGCGVFMQNPHEVAEIFFNLLRSGKYNFKNAIFPIPGGNNLKVFQDVLQKYV